MLKKVSPSEVLDILLKVVFAICAIGVASLALASFATYASFADAGPGPIAPNTHLAKFDQEGVLTLSGQVGAGKGLVVPIKVLDPNGQIVYLANSPTDDFGKYSLKISLSKGNYGDYQVMIGPYSGAQKTSHQSLTPIKLGATYTRPTNSLFAQVEASVVTGQDQQALAVVKGDSNIGVGRVLGIKVVNPQGKIDYLGTTIIQAGGKIDFSYPLTSSCCGRYTLALSTGSNGQPLVAQYFDYLELNKIIITGVTENQKTVLDPQLSSKTTNYTVAADPKVNGLEIKATARDSTAIINYKVNGIDQTLSKNGMVSAKLTSGINLVQVQLSGKDGKSSRQYTVKVVSSKAGEEGGTLTASPSDTQSEVIIRGHYGNQAGRAVAITVKDPQNRMTFIGTAQTQANGDFYLRYGLTNPALGLYVVEARGHKGIQILRDSFEIRAAQPLLRGLSVTGAILAFDPQVLDYTLTLGDTQKQVEVTATLADLQHKLSIDNQPATSGKPSMTIPLKPGDNLIIATVTALGGQQKNYRIHITQKPQEKPPVIESPTTPEPPVSPETPDPPVLSGNTKLTSVSIRDTNTDASIALSPQFQPVQFQYTAQVPYNCTEITLTPIAEAGGAASPTIKVKGTVVQSNTQSPNIQLEEGTNTVHVDVTAPNGSVQRYTLTITRAPATAADLLTLDCSGLSLTPSFDRSVSMYTITVPNNRNSVHLMANLASADATVATNGNPSIVTDGIMEDNVALNVGTNTVAIDVRASSGIEKRYTVVITREGANNAQLSSISISGLGQFNFISDLYNYTIDVANGVESIQVTAETDDANAQLQVNNQPLGSGVASQVIPLIVGDNTIVLLVTAEDGVTKKTYTLTVKRAAP